MPRRSQKDSRLAQGWALSIRSGGSGEGVLAINRVCAGSLYTFQPVPLDQDFPPFGVVRGTLGPGSTVRVVDLPGQPAANTMGHAYIEDPETGEYLGLVHCNSLRAIQKAGQR